LADQSAGINAGRVPRREPLSLRRIAHAALSLLDEAGLTAVTMRAVAQRLGVEAMSLYRYVASRDRMLDAVIDVVVDELADDPEVELTPSESWQPWLESMARGVRRYSRKHPRAFPLIATHPSESPWLNPPLRSERWVEALLAGLLAEGFTDEQALYAYRVFNTFLLGHLIIETTAMVSGADAPEGTHPPGDESTEYPTITRLARELAGDRWDDEFDSGLEAMVERIEQALAG
jgi:AcrR family transcriptional regulator